METDLECNCWKKKCKKCLSSAKLQYQGHSALQPWVKEKNFSKLYHLILAFSHRRNYAFFSPFLCLFAGQCSLCPCLSYFEEPRTEPSTVASPVLRRVESLPSTHWKYITTAWDSIFCLCCKGTFLAPPGSPCSFLQSCSSAEYSSAYRGTWDLFFLKCRILHFSLFNFIKFLHLQFLHPNLISSTFIASSILVWCLVSSSINGK